MAYDASYRNQSLVFHYYYFFPAQRSQIGMDLAVCSELYSGVRNYILSSFRPGFKKEPDV